MEDISKYCNFCNEHSKAERPATFLMWRKAKMHHLHKIIEKQNSVIKSNQMMFIQTLPPGWPEYGQKASTGSPCLNAVERLREIDKKAYSEELLFDSSENELFLLEEG